MLLGVAECGIGGEVLGGDVGDEKNFISQNTVLSQVSGYIR